MAVSHFGNFFVYTYCIKACKVFAKSLQNVFSYILFAE